MKRRSTTMPRTRASMKRIASSRSQKRNLGGSSRWRGIASSESSMPASCAPPLDEPADQAVDDARADGEHDPEHEPDERRERRPASKADHGADDEGRDREGASEIALGPALEEGVQRLELDAGGACGREPSADEADDEADPEQELLAGQRNGLAE